MVQFFRRPSHPFTAFQAKRGEMLLGDSEWTNPAPDLAPDPSRWVRIFRVASLGDFVADGANDRVSALF